MTSLRSLADQSDDELGGPASILVRQRRDHERLDQFLTRIHVTSGATQQTALNDLARLVFPHAFAEESVLWPLARRRLPDGPQLTLAIEQEHQQINELWSELETLTAGDPRRVEVLERLTVLLRQDVRDEEDELLPQFQARLNPRELRRIGWLWTVVRHTAPTRPHAVVTRRPPGNVAAALPLTVLDRSRDRLDRLSLSGRGPASVHRAAGAFSRRLAAIAGAVEHGPLMSRGDHPSTRAADQRGARRHE